MIASLNFTLRGVINIENCSNVVCQTKVYTRCFSTDCIDLQA